MPQTFALCDAVTAKAPPCEGGYGATYGALRVLRHRCGRASVPPLQRTSKCLRILWGYSMINPVGLAPLK